MSPLVAGATAAIAVVLLAGLAGKLGSARAGVIARRRVVGLVDDGRGTGIGGLHTVPPALVRLLHDAGVPGDPAVAVQSWALAAVLVPAAVTVVAGPVLAGLAGVAVVVGPMLAARTRRARRGALADRELPRFLDAVGRALRAGASLRQSLHAAVPAVDGTFLGDDAHSLGRALEGGRPLDEALDGFAGADPGPVRRLAVDALALAGAVGGAPAGLVERVAETARERAAVSREAKALAAQARASAVVIVAAPAVFAVLVTAVDPRIADFVTSPVGIACVVAGLACDGVGAWWMVRITRGSR